MAAPGPLSAAPGTGASGYGAAPGFGGTLKTQSLVPQVQSACLSPDALPLPRGEGNTSASGKCQKDPDRARSGSRTLGSLSHTL